MAHITLNQIAYDLIEFYRANIKDTDSVSLRQIKYWVNVERANIINQKLDKNFYDISHNYLQDIGILSVEKVDSSRLTGISSSDNIYRTIPIPATFRDSNQLATIYYAGYADYLGSSFTQVPNKTLKRAGIGKFKDKFNYYTLMPDNRLYFTGQFMPNEVVITGIFQNAKEAALFADTTYTDDSPYPIDIEDVNILKDLIKQKDIRLVISQLEDKIANGADDIVNISSK